MAARAIVQERRTLAIQKIRKDAAAIGEVLGVDASALAQDMKGDAAYQEMVRTEQLAELLAAVREKVAPKKEESRPAPPAPVVETRSPALSHVEARTVGRPKKSH